MKLIDIDQQEYAPRALKENYGISLPIKSMSIPETKDILKKVRNLAEEVKTAPDFYKNQTSPTYMKLVFMEQALVEHYNELIAKPRPQIVVENEEVEKSQVVLAAQDMVDSVQKMIEDVSDMLVKELPALIDSVQSEIGVNESEQFNTQATEALTGLTGALTQAKTALQGALNVVTGQGGDAFGAEEGGMGDMGADDGMGDMGADDGMGDMGADDGMGGDFPAGDEEPEAQPVSGVGRVKR